MPDSRLQTPDSRLSKLQTLEPSPLGRVIIPDPSLALFYTTSDITGYLDDASVEMIRTFIRERFNLDTTLSTCAQVHGTTAVRARQGASWCESASCDALWSDESQVALGIKVADCLPVTLADLDHRVIANIHSGWRGAAARIVDATLDALERETDFDAARAKAVLGPSIRVCCFEVGEEVIAALETSHESIADATDRTRGERPHVDLAAITTRRLMDRGFAAGSIVDTGLCTRCDGSIFHSYRRDGARNGRNLAIVAQ